MSAPKTECGLGGQYLTFRLDAQSYGVPIGAVREINRVGEITAVPRTPAFVKGVINLRGHVIPVVDLRVKFDVKESAYTKETCVIVIEGETGQIGMIVDAVKEVVALESTQIEPAPTLGNAEELKYVLGMGKAEDRVIILVDIVQALSRENLEQLREISRQPEKAA